MMLRVSHGPVDALTVYEFKVRDRVSIVDLAT
jgi:hypothetical protein